jgi:hypothetical protein
MRLQWCGMARHGKVDGGRLVSPQCLHDGDGSTLIEDAKDAKHHKIAYYQDWDDDFLESVNAAQCLGCTNDE